MGALMLQVCLVAAVVASLSRAAPVSGSALEVFVRSPISVHRGHTTVLPCQLNPPQSTTGLLVSWYRGLDTTPIIAYQTKKFEDPSQESSYAGRASFVSKDAGSPWLLAGDVGLKLDKVTMEDAGNYTCYASSEQGYDKATVILTVRELGRVPLLSTVFKDNMMIVSCESEGWYPEPTLHWRYQNQPCEPGSLKHTKESSGLWSVHSWLHVNSSAEVSCTVGISGEEVKEARTRVESPTQPVVSSGNGWKVFSIILIVLVLVGAILLGLFLKHRRMKAKSGNHDIQENQKLLPQAVIQPTDLSTARKNYAKVTLNEMGNQYLRIKGAKLRDENIEFPDGNRVTCLTAIRGEAGFSTGQHYWEVSLGNHKIEPKLSWWIGVTSANVIPNEVDFSPTASDGFWFLSSSPDRADHFQLSTEPVISLSFNSRPQTIGVYLDCDSGELSFYDVEKGFLIGSLRANFSGDIFPLFNPGKGDKAVMEILQTVSPLSPSQELQGQCHPDETG